MNQRLQYLLSGRWQVFIMHRHSSFWELTDSKSGFSVAPIAYSLMAFFVTHQKPSTVNYGLFEGVSLTDLFDFSTLTLTPSKCCQEIVLCHDSKRLSAIAFVICSNRYYTSLTIYFLFLSLFLRQIECCNLFLVIAWRVDYSINGKHKPAGKKAFNS